VTSTSRFQVVLAANIGKSQSSEAPEPTEQGFEGLGCGRLSPLSRGRQYVDAGLIDWHDRPGASVVESLIPARLDRLQWSRSIPG
jgi:hypothetical protein